VPCVGTCPRRKSPPAARTIPNKGTRLALINLTPACERPAPITIPAVTGRNARPAFSGLYPSTSCTYSEEERLAGRPPASRVADLLVREPVVVPQKLAAVVGV
jgi:hypothetical protein